MDQPIQPIQPNPTPEAPVNPSEAVPQPLPPEVQPAGLASPAVAPAMPPVATPAPVALPVAPATPAPVAPVASGPQAAEDVDVIEKEWVDAAEQIVKKTAGDPHAEEEAIEDLQIDYLKKRYGKDVKKSVE